MCLQCLESMANCRTANLVVFHYMTYIAKKKKTGIHRNVRYNQRHKILEGWINAETKSFPFISKLLFYMNITIFLIKY